MVLYDHVGMMVSAAFGCGYAKHMAGNWNRVQSPKYVAACLLKVLDVSMSHKVVATSKFLLTPFVQRWLK